MHCQYYARCMPIKWLLTKWLGSDLSTLEWSMDFENDIKVRYIQFKDVDDMRAKLLEKKPLAVHLGPRYSHSPSLHNKLPKDAFRPVSRHLTFDIDADAYDNVRFCCKKKAICSKCWPLLVAAVRIVDTTLREAFGFKSILWVYSGGRGVHCWVSDTRARELSSEARWSITEYINADFKSWQFSKGQAQEWYELVEPIFQEYINRQRQYMGIDGYEDLLLTFMNAKEQEAMPKLNEVKIDYTESAWPFFKEAYNKARPYNYTRAEWEGMLQRIVLNVIQPRLDEKVTKEMTHLMKIPFSVHPRTKRICCPLDPTDRDGLMSFDPLKVPTVDELIAQVDEKDGNLNATILKSWFGIIRKVTLPEKKKKKVPVKEEEEEKEEW